MTQDKPKRKYARPPLDEATHNRLKAWCAARGLDFITGVNRLIDTAVYVEESLHVVTGSDTTNPPEAQR